MLLSVWKYIKYVYQGLQTQMENLLDEMKVMVFFMNKKGQKRITYYLNNVYTEVKETRQSSASNISFSINL